MTMEEAAGPAGPKVLRLLYFVGAGFICTVAINKWRELERKSILKEHQQQRQQQQHLENESALLSQSPSNGVHEAIK